MAPILHMRRAHAKDREVKIRYKKRVKKLKVKNQITNKKVRNKQFTVFHTLMASHGLLGSITNQGAEIKQLIGECNEVNSLNELKSRIIAMDRTLYEEGDKIATYDRKRILETIHMLMREVDARNNVINRKQFAFRGEPKPPRQKIAQRLNEGQNQASSPTKSGPHNSCAFSTVINQKLPLPTGTNHQHVLIADIEDSVIYTQPDLVTASVHIRGGTRSVVSIVSEGPIFIHDVHDVVLLLRCHQLRLHNVRNSVVMVEVSNNRIVIENSDGLLVGGYQDEEVNVDDFNWPTRSKNEHFTTMYPALAGIVRELAENVSELRPQNLSAHLQEICVAANNPASG